MSVSPSAGMGLALDPAKSVFINCPYDSEYSILFDAILFASVCCGFMPRSAIESGTVAKPRLGRITEAMFSSRYSIHDLSRCTGEGNENLARFNMPLELGMAMARCFLDSTCHDWLVLVRKGHPYAAFVSDLAAYDPPTYDGSVQGVVAPVVAWLSQRPNAVSLVTPSQVLAAFPEFQARKENLQAAWFGHLSWTGAISAAREVAKTLA